MKRLTLALLSLLTLSALAGCNTWHGFGEDLTAAGESITNKDKESGY